MNNGPALSVLGISKGHAKRAIQWLKDRSFPAFYRETDKSLNAFEYQGGRERTYAVLNDAIDATRK